MAKKRIVVDFDNTMGVPGCDVDDGLALLMLLGNPDLCTLEGMCTTFGNSTIDITYQNTLDLAAQLGLSAPVFKGGANPQEPVSDAARFLATIVAENPGEISIMATGSLTNLKGAAQLNPQFFEQVREIALMGGVLGALTINGKIMNELNFACDAEAALMTLQAPCPVMDAVSQNCLPCTITREEFTAEFGASSWLLKTCDYWLRTMEEAYHQDSFICWDIVSAAYLVRPDLFCDQVLPVALNPLWLQVGLLETQSMPGTPTTPVNLPTIKDTAAFKAAIFESLHRACDNL